MRSAERSFRSHTIITRLCSFAVFSPVSLFKIIFQIYGPPIPHPTSLFLKIKTPPLFVKKPGESDRKKSGSPYAMSWDARSVMRLLIAVPIYGIGFRMYIELVLHMRF